MSEAPATLAVLARIPYLNASPFYIRWAEAPGTTVDLPPKMLGDEARAGRADAGLMAAADWFDLDPKFERVGPFGITCRGAVSSVFLLARRPFEELFAGGLSVTVDLTTESQTSVALTRILLQGRFGATDVRYVRRPVEAGATPNGDAWLLIGDAALRARRTVERDGLYLLDLGKTWEEWTGLPFVYAVWTVRASLPTEEKARLEAFLERSLEEGERSIDAITAGAAIADPTLGDAPTLSTYLRAFRYRLGPDEEKGLAKFRELWAALEGATP